MPTTQFLENLFTAPASIPSSTPEITLALPSETPTQLIATETPLPFSTATINVMQLFFPTVIPAEGTEYRPPLYPTPWALSPFDHFFFAAPLAATYAGEPVWDYRYGGIYFAPDVIHSGIDLPAPLGAEVLAAGPGTVVWAGIGLFSSSSNDLNDPYGLAVAIRHDFGYKDQPLYTIYAHMEKVLVIVGQWVNTGDVLGKVGETGVSTGPHLHFEVRLGENAFLMTRNPELWVSPPEGYGVLVGRVMTTYGQRLDSYEIQLKSLDTGKYYLVKTYGALVANSDSYYNENVVLGDLRAGVYELSIPYGLYRQVNIQILPGQITYFSFYGYNGYDSTLPPAPETNMP
ncbi:MAG: M23 family metallopeptidase [Chloroflexi bacterium]|nr:M23 family metallopeptidase [Chloroflexota bacterium]